MRTSIDFDDFSVILWDGDEEITRTPPFPHLGRAVHIESKFRRQLANPVCGCGNVGSHFLDIDFSSATILTLCDDCYTEGLEETWAELGSDR